MTDNSCNHCGFDVPPGQAKCPNCGTPLPQDKGGDKPSRFLLFFVLIVVFSLAMVFILPR